MKIENNKNSKILAVDDNPANLGILFHYLSTFDFTVLLVQNGEKALRAAANENPDIILLDIMMPDMDGFEICQCLKESEKTKDIPVIFMSALTDTMDKVKGFKLGAVDYITKPFQQEEVLARVKIHLRIRELEKSLKEQNIQLQKEIAERIQAEEIRRKYAEDLEREREKSDKLLLNILPVKVANELKEKGKTKPESFENVTVFFSDLVNFTPISARYNPEFVISELNEMFTDFDDIMSKHYCERIQIVGDAYLAVCGMPVRNEQHAENMIKAAKEVISYLQNRNNGAKQPWQIRIGIHSGEVVGGVVGIRKYSYNVFGDAINTASRTESHSEPMKINVSETTYQKVKNKFSFRERKAIEVKGKGKMKMYFLENI